MAKVVVTLNKLVKHRGEKLYPLPYTFSEKMADYIVRMGWGTITPDAEPVDDMGHLTVSDDVVNNATGKRVFA